MVDNYEDFEEWHSPSVLVPIGYDKNGLAEETRKVVDSFLDYHSRVQHVAEDDIYLDYQSKGVEVTVIACKRVAESLVLWLLAVTGLKTHVVPENWFGAGPVVRVDVSDYLRLCEYVRSNFYSEFEQFCTGKKATKLLGVVKDNSDVQFRYMSASEAGLLLEFLDTRAKCTFKTFFAMNGGLREAIFDWLAHDNLQCLTQDEFEKRRCQEPENYLGRGTSPFILNKLICERRARINAKKQS